MDKSNVYLKKFQMAILILVGTLLLTIFVIYKTVPQVQQIFNLQDQYKAQSAALVDAERQLEALKAEAARREAEDEKALKIFFRPINEGLDSEAAISDEFGEILQLLRENKIKTRSVNYEYDPKDDNFVKNVSYKYHVCKISAEMIANYANFENFLRDLYRHEHFLDILSVEITPYQKNKRILLINLQLKLYAQKDPSTEPPAPAQTAPSDGTAQPQDGSAPASPSPSAIPSPQPITPGGVSPEANAQ